MLNMVRAQLYRIAKSRFSVFYAIILFVIAAATPFALWLHNVWPAFAETGFVEVPADPLPSLQFYGVSFLGGSFAAMGVGVAVSELVAGDFKSGYVKNLVQARGGRTSYAVAVAACALAIAAATTLFGMIIVEGALRLQAIFLGGGAVESVCKLVLANIPGIPAALRDCLDGYLATDLGTLAQGVVCDPMAYVQAGATILVVGAACVLVMRRRSLG